MTSNADGSPRSNRVPALGLLVLMALLGACGGQPPGSREENQRTGQETGAGGSEQAEEALIRQAVEKCRRNQPRIESLMAQLRRAEGDLAAAKRDGYVSTPAPKKPFDSETESRFRPEDQELDSQRYQAALAEWESREARERRRWEAAQQQRIVEAQNLLDTTARQLRELEPTLFTGPGSIEFVPVVASRVTSCDARGFRAASADRKP